MELKDIINELKVVSDVNKYSTDVLAERYLSSAEKFDYFMTNYCNYFKKNRLYQLRAFDKYEKVLNIVETGYLMYPTYDNKTDYNGLVNVMRYNVDSYEKYDDADQAKFIFMDVVGAYKSRDGKSYEEVVNGIADVARLYGYRGDKSIDDFEKYLAYVQKCGYPNKIYEYIKKYYNDHPLMSECNNINFLYLTNLMLYSYTSLVTDEFIQDAKSIINVSRIENYYNDNDDYYDDIKNYNRVAKYTLRNIKKYEKQKLMLENPKEKKLVK